MTPEEENANLRKALQETTATLKCCVFYMVEAPEQLLNRMEEHCRLNQMYFRNAALLKQVSHE